MKKHAFAVIVAISMLVTGCTPYDQTAIRDYGLKEIEPGVFLKRIQSGNDRIYYFVDRNGKITHQCVNTIITKTPNVTTCE